MMMTATITTIVGAMTEGWGDCAYDENKCSDRIVGTNERRAGGGGGLGGMILTVPS
jgi:hypothetical protein